MHDCSIARMAAHKAIITRIIDHHPLGGGGNGILKPPATKEVGSQSALQGLSKRNMAMGHNKH